jgi:hypothetical protein
MKLSFYLLNGIKLLMDKTGRNIGELKHEGWIRELAFLVNVTGHVSNFDNELQSKISSLPRCTTIARSSKSSFDCEETS